MKLCGDIWRAPNRFFLFFFKLPDPMISEAREKMMKHASNFRNYRVVVNVIQDDELRFLFPDVQYFFGKYRRFIDQF